MKPSHDPQCPTPYLQQATCHYCQLIAKVRADERERTVPKCERCQRLWMRLDDAEKVAARLVEVIVQDEAVAARLVEVIVEMQSDIDHAWAVANGEARR